MTTHGCRSSFRDWAGDETHFERDVAEMALAHKVGDEVEQVEQPLSLEDVFEWYRDCPEQIERAVIAGRTERQFDRAPTTTVYIGMP